MVTPNPPVGSSDAPPPQQEPPGTIREERRHHPDYMGKKPTHELIHRLHAEHQAAIHRMLSENHRHVGSIDADELARPEMRGPDGR